MYEESKVWSGNLSFRGKKLKEMSREELLGVIYYLLEKERKTRASMGKRARDLKEAIGHLKSE